MEGIILKNVCCSYGNNNVLYDVSINIGKGEIYTLLGPSGCGKTTMLRCIAGFKSIDGGSIFADGEDITSMPIEKRNMGIVFQNYALFPNMTVEENIRYGLKIRHMPKDKIQEQLDKYVALTGLEKYIHRAVDELSGGQQQRVAVARALVLEPRLLLLDEPMSNLDAETREKMLKGIRILQRKTGITILMITHNCLEALSISDKIGIMKDGCVQQEGTPYELYYEPKNRFVAQFVGDANFLPPEVFTKLGVAEKRLGMLRPEELTLKPYCENGIRGIISDIQFFGAYSRYEIDTDYGILCVVEMGKRVYDWKISDIVTVMVNG